MLYHALAWFLLLYHISDCALLPLEIVFLKDVSHSALKDLIQFMYCGEVNVKQDALPAFISTAEALQIKGLTDVSVFIFYCLQKCISDAIFDRWRTQAKPTLHFLIRALIFVVFVFMSFFLLWSLLDFLFEILWFFILLAENMINLEIIFFLYP